MHRLALLGRRAFAGDQRRVVGAQERRRDRVVALVLGCRVYGELRLRGLGRLFSLALPLVAGGDLGVDLGCRWRGRGRRLVLRQRGQQRRVDDVAAIRHRLDWSLDIWQRL